MTNCLPALAAAAPPLAAEEIHSRVKQCQRLPALSSINSTLRELLCAEECYTHQISDVIRRDPSLTARLLRVVNSVYYGLPRRVAGVEQAVLYLGIRQVRQLAVIAPVMDNFECLDSNGLFTWRHFWQHCIGTAVIADELWSLGRMPQDETAYVAGLLHDVGKIVMASVFPEHFVAVRKRVDNAESDLLTAEREILGADHAEIGALYLEHHQLPEALVNAARFHHDRAGAAHEIAAAVNLADLFVRDAAIGKSGNLAQVARADWFNSPAWSTLCPELSEQGRANACASITRTVTRLPLILQGLL